MKYFKTDEKLTNPNDRISAVALLAALAAGFINGAIGAGGGVILVFALSKLGLFDDPKDVFSNTVSVMIPVSALSLLKYIENGGTTPSAAIILPAIAGGAAGALLSSKIKSSAMKLIFALLTAVAGINILLR